MYDPRDGTTAWSDNVALCSRDYLASDYGFNCTAAEINDTYFSPALSRQIADAFRAGGDKVARRALTDCADRGDQLRYFALAWPLLAAAR